MNITNVDTMTTQLYEYLLDIVKLSPTELQIIKSALSMIKEMSPTDPPLILKKTNDLISVSQDLAWVILILSKKADDLKRDIRKTRDPHFVMLVRQGRPSSAAIEAEIRMNVKELYDKDNNYDTLNNIIEYLKYIQNSIDRYIWHLRDKNSFSRV